MTTLSNPETDVDLPLVGSALHAVLTLKNLAHLRQHASPTTSRDDRRTISPRPRARTKSRPQLGGAVLHGTYGPGKVMAHWPDGTLLVRFDRLRKSRLVSPSHLGRFRSGER